MRLHVRRGSRRHGCPLLKDEDNEVWAMVFNQDGLPTAEARAQALAAAANFLAVHGEHLAALLEYIAEDPMAPQWERMAAASFGMDLLGALHAGGRGAGAGGAGEPGGPAGGKGMKVATPRPAVTFTASQEEAGALLLHLHAEGFCGVADGLVRPRITVPGISQEALNELCRTWARRCFEAKLAREKREGARG